MNIFLDLEETLIDNWGNCVPVNVDIVRSWLKNMDASEVTIFSFAVWDNDHVKEFYECICPTIEKVFGFKVIDCVDMNRVMNADFQLTRTHFDNLTDYISVRGKTDSFRNWCKINHLAQTSVLLDDIVPNMLVVDFDTNTQIQTVNVTKLD